MIKFRRSMKFILTGSAICIVLLLVAIAGIRSHRRWFRGELFPKDAQLIEQFHRTRADLERLREMVLEDQLNPGIGFRAVGDKNLASDRVEAYRRLMKQAGVKRISTVSVRGLIEFTVDSTPTFLDIGAGKGFVYSKAAGAVVPSLDQRCFPSDPKESYCQEYRPLGEEWWLVRYDYHK